MPTPSTSQVFASNPDPLLVPEWRQFDWLWHGFSTRPGGVSTAYCPDGASSGGELNLGFRPEDLYDHVLENRHRFVAAITGDRETPLQTIRQVHSDRSVLADRLETPCEGDGLMTATPGLLIGILTADCIPVLVVDPVGRAVSAFHAGWRGTVAGIVEQGIDKMRRQFGSEPASLLAAIGPGIGPCCYSVGEEVQARFLASFVYADQLFGREDESIGGTKRLNLIEANRRQLLAAGVRAESISVVRGCTSCQPNLFFSHRASGGRTGRMMAAIGIRED